MKLLFIGLGGLIIVAAFVVIMSSDAASGERADIAGQGGAEPPIAEGGAELVRREDGIRVHADLPTPAPGSYEYPTGDMVRPGAPLHPEVSSGGPDQPEVFTMWIFIFNYPDECTDDECDLDDIGDTPAKGGVYQGDGRIATEATLELSGGVRVGQVAVNGSSLENPIGAEVHVGIAPHGRALAGDDLRAQLNSPLGNPTLWWPASFIPQRASG